MLAGDLELVRDVNTSPGGGDPDSLVAVGDSLYFRANDGASGVELWKSDGTAAGTVRVKDIRPGAADSFPSNLTNVNGTLYFSANDGVTGYELWKSDGTATGTVRVKDVFTGVYASSPTDLANVGGVLFFSASGRTTSGVSTGNELWKSDGTDAGTVLVKDVGPGLSIGNPNNKTVVNGTLFFRANAAPSGVELWKSDGTTSGTVLVKDIRPGGADSYPRHLTNVGGTLYFSANDGVSGAELWKTDGTTSGTVLVKDIAPGNAYPRYLTNVGGTLFFTANDGVSGVELWRSNGTSAGTVRVKDILPGAVGADPRDLTNVGGTLYFRANDGATGRELWKSNGTEVGTVRVKDILPGSLSSYVADLASVGSTLYFSADDGATGRELWKSNGTSAGTVPVRLPSNVPLQSPSDVTAVRDRLFVSGARPDVGRELFSLVLLDPPFPPGDYDRNGFVQQADRDLWAADYGSGVRLRADGNGDGVVNVADYTVWRDNLGRGGVIEGSSATALAASSPALGETLDVDEFDVLSPFDAITVATHSGTRRSAPAPQATPAGRQAFTPARRADLLLVERISLPPTTSSEAAPLQAKASSSVDDARARAFDEALAALFAKEDEWRTKGTTDKLQ
jgi:ELWxxDGT repeat protein